MAERGLADRAFALLLRIWPEALLERHGGEMRNTFAARVAARRASGRGVVPLVVRELAGVLRAGWKARRALGRAHPPQGTGRGFRMETFVQDVRYALRGMGRNPGFTAVVVCVLALGIGANTAIFSVLNATLLRDLPARDPEQLVSIRETNPEKGWEAVVAAPANLLDWREQVSAFDDVAGWLDPGTQPMTGEGEPELVRTSWVTGNFFDLLGVRAAHGRLLRDEETWNTEPRVIVLSDGFWTRRFGRDPSIMGRSLTLGGRDWEVVGIAPPGFAFPGQELDVWLPIRFDPSNREQVFFRRAHYINAIARLGPGVTLAQADAELQVVVRRLQEQYPETNRVMGAVIFPLQRHLTADVRTPLLLLQGAVLLLLLVACANVGNLLLVRAVGQRREMAVRMALGAGRRRVAALALTESTMFSLLGGILGVAAGSLLLRALRGLMPTGLPANIGLDTTVLLFAVVLTVVAGVAFGLAPALGGQVRLDDALRSGGRTGSAGRHTLRMSSLLVVSEIALAVVLVLGAGLLVRSFGALRDVDPGFRIADRVTAQVPLPGARYDTPEKVIAFFDRLLDHLESSPGIESASLSRTLPLAGFSFTSDFTMEHWAPDRFGAEVTLETVSASYFETMGIPLLRGRLIEETDRADTERVVVINQALVDRYFPDEDPLGRMIAPYDRVATENTLWARIVGIVGDVYQTGLADPPIIQLYSPYTQDTPASARVVAHAPLSTSTDAIARIRAAVREIDAEIPLAHVNTLEEVYSRSLRAERFLLVLLGAFALLALLLAALGVYGVASQAARRRTQEIGIRMALGARRGDVARLILRQALGPVGVGVVLGLAGGFAATRLMGSLLYGIAPNDAVTFAAVPIILAVAALVATLLPVRAATQVDPLRALHTE